MAPHVDVKFTFRIRHIIHTSKTRWSSHCKKEIALLVLLLHATYCMLHPLLW